MKNDLIIKSPLYPFAVGWCITNKCNLHCKHCNMNSGKPDENELSLDECKKIIDELVQNKVQKIMFSGGEPLSRTDFFEISNYAFSKGIVISMTTNSLLLTDDIIKNELYKFEIIRVSLDGNNEEEHEFIRNKKGSYKKTIDNIKKMIHHGINVGIVTCISKRNIDSFEEMALMLNKLGIRRWYLPLLSPNGRGAKIENEALSSLETRDFLLRVSKISEQVSFSINLDTPYYVLLKQENEVKNVSAACPAAVSEMVILSNGDISPCCQLPVIGGNCFKEGIKSVWNNSKVFKEFRNRSLLKGNCSKCKFIMACGGCRANAYVKYKDYLEGDDMCWKSID